MAHRFGSSALSRARGWLRHGRSSARRTVASLRWTGRALTGTTGVPERAWSRSTEADRETGLIPLPPALGLTSWLWGQSTARLDAGDLTEVRLGLRAASATLEAPLAPDEFDLDELTALLPPGTADRLSRRPGVVLVTRAGQAPHVRARLRALELHRTVLVVEDPGTARRAELWSLVSILVLPDRGGVCGDLETEGRLLGRCILHVSPGQGLPEDLGSPEQRRTAGRLSRLTASRSTCSPLVTVPGPLRILHSVKESRRVAIAGHDLKFVIPLVRHLQAEGHDVRLDRWSGHARHDPQASRALADWADVVLCEWALGNAVWYSRNVPPQTRLVTRVHLQEAGTGFPGRVDLDRLSAAVFVAEHVRRQVVRDHGWPLERTLVVPNAVHVPERLPERDPLTRFRLGLVGMVPARKGLHAALDVLTQLREVDDRYKLSLRGRLPSEVTWLAGRDSEQAYFRRQMTRIEEEPALRGAVEFSPHGPEMDQWYATVGVALSCSDYESFHFTLPDGAVHGALPRSLAWPGADLLYPTDWLEPDAVSLAQSIHRAVQDPDRWARSARRARDVVADRFGQEQVLPLLADAVLGIRPGHRRPTDEPTITVEENQP